MNATPTIPRPTTTTFFRRGLAPFSSFASNRSSSFTLIFPACMPGDDSDHDMMTKERDAEIQLVYTDGEETNGSGKTVGKKWRSNGTSDALRSRKR